MGLIYCWLIVGKSLSLVGHGLNTKCCGSNIHDASRSLCCSSGVIINVTTGNEVCCPHAPLGEFCDQLNWRYKMVQPMQWARNADILEIMTLMLLVTVCLCIMRCQSLTILGCTVRMNLNLLLLSVYDSLLFNSSTPTHGFSWWIISFDVSVGTGQCKQTLMYVHCPSGASESSDFMALYKFTLLTYLFTYWRHYTELVLYCVIISLFRLRQLNNTSLLRRSSIS